MAGKLIQPSAKVSPVNGICIPRQAFRRSSVGPGRAENRHRRPPESGDDSLSSGTATHAPRADVDHLLAQKRTRLNLSPNADASRANRPNASRKVLRGWSCPASPKTATSPPSSRCSKRPGFRSNRLNRSGTTIRPKRRLVDGTQRSGTHDRWRPGHRCPRNHQRRPERRRLRDALLSQRGSPRSPGDLEIPDDEVENYIDALQPGRSVVTRARRPFAGSTDGCFGE